MELRFVTAENRDYLLLAERLDAYYFSLVGDIQLRYAEANRPESFACRAVAYEGDVPVGCGCWKPAGETTAEIKRIYVEPKFRRCGVASMIIRTLERDIAASGYQRIVLETACTTQDSAALYLALGYHQIEYYGSPAGAGNSVCFGKEI